MVVQRRPADDHEIVCCFYGMLIVSQNSVRMDELVDQLLEATSGPVQLLL